MGIRIRKLIIDNFQSVGSGVFRFTEGLNVIVGENNLGKSALFRTLRWVIRDAYRGTWFAKDFETQCKVGVQSQKDFIVSREVVRTLTSEGKTDRLKVNNYSVLHRDGRVQEFDKFKGIPVEVRDALGISLPIVLGKTSDEIIDLNFADQHRDAIFLLNKPPSLLARLLSHAMGLQPIHKSMRELSVRHRRLNQEVKQEQERGDELLVRVKKFPAAKLEESFEKMASKVRAVKELGNLYNEISNQADRYQQADVEAKSAKKQYHSIKALCALPWSDAISKFDELRQVQVAAQAYDDSDVQVREATEQLDGIGRMLGKIDNFLPGAMELASVAQTYMKVDLEIPIMARAVVEVEDSLLAWDDEYKSVLDEAGVCPTCGQSTKELK